MCTMVNRTSPSPVIAINVLPPIELLRYLETPAILPLRCQNFRPFAGVQRPLLLYPAARGRPVLNRAPSFSPHPPPSEAKVGVTTDTGPCPRCTPRPRGE